MIENWTDDTGQRYLQEAGIKYMEDMLAAYKSGHLDAGVGKVVLNQIQHRLTPLLKEMERDYKSEQVGIQQGFIDAAKI